MLILLLILLLPSKSETLIALSRPRWLHLFKKRKKNYVNSTPNVTATLNKWDPYRTFCLLAFSSFLSSKFRSRLHAALIFYEMRLSCRPRPHSWGVWCEGELGRACVVSAPDGLFSPPLSHFLALGGWIFFYYIFLEKYVNFTPTLIPTLEKWDPYRTLPPSAAASFLFLRKYVNPTPNLTPTLKKWDPLSFLALGGCTFFLILEKIC